MHFSLVKMNPPDASPSHGFDDLILPLYFALRRLGFATELRFNTCNPASRNIIFGSCIAPRRIGRTIPANSIIFNLEQINENSKWCNNDYLTHLRDFAVWDYSAENIAGLDHLGVKGCAHVPFGYVPEMRRITRASNPDVELLFYGLITERRQALVSRLFNSGVHILASQAAFGALRDTLLGRTRLVLNIHQFLPARLEIVRLGYVWANSVAVLSERRHDTEIPEYLHEACAFAEYDDLFETARGLLAEPERIRQQAERGFRAFSSHPFTESVERVVGKRVRAVALSLDVDGAGERAAESARGCLQIRSFAPEARDPALLAKGVYSSRTRPEKKGPDDAANGQKNSLETAPTSAVGSGSAGGTDEWQERANFLQNA